VGPTSIATVTATPSVVDGSGDRTDGATVTADPTRNPLVTSRSCGATGRSSMARVVVAGMSKARARSATESRSH
jgi:hypothetical protein